LISVDTLCPNKETLSPASLGFTRFCLRYRTQCETPHATTTVSSRMMKRKKLYSRLMMLKMTGPKIRRKSKS